MIKSLSRFDISKFGIGPRQKLLIQFVFGMLCAFCMIALRLMVDMVAPTSGPFALVYPTVLIATLFGHKLAGFAAYVVCFVWAWWFVLAPVNSFAFEDPSDLGRVIINASSALIILILAETFRKAVQDGNKANENEIKRQAVLMEELDHRTKNNFAMVSSLLSLQKRDVESVEAIDVLEQASARVHMFAKAYENLSDTKDEGFPVEMRSYLGDVVERLKLGGFDERVIFRFAASDCVLPRQTAVNLGIFVNEAVTNCAKYAFPDGRAGEIDISFSGSEDGWILQVSDDGVGSGGSSAKMKSVGSSLMAALAKQVDAEHEIRFSPEGTMVEVRHKAGNA